MLPPFTAGLGTEVLFHPGGSCFAIPPGSPLGTFIAVRSAPDPTLDMDLRVGNFLLVE